MRFIFFLPSLLQNIQSGGSLEDPEPRVYPEVLDCSEASSPSVHCIICFWLTLGSNHGVTHVLVAKSLGRDDTTLPFDSLLQVAPVLNHEFLEIVQVCFQALCIYAGKQKIHYLIYQSAQCISLALFVHECNHCFLLTLS